MDKLNIKDAAAYVGRSEKTLRRWAKKGKLQFELESGEYRFLKSDLDILKQSLAQGERRKTEQTAEKAGEQEEKKQPASVKTVAPAADAITPIIDALAGTVDVLKSQLGIKDKQLEAKDKQINKLMDAQERSDILLKGLQDRVRRLEAPQGAEAGQDVEEQQERELDTKKDVHANVQEDVQPQDNRVQPEASSGATKAEVVDGDFEEADQAETEDVQSNQVNDVQPDAETDQAQEQRGGGGVSNQSTGQQAKQEQGLPSVARPKRAKEGTGEPEAPEQEPEQPPKKHRRLWPF